MDTKAPIVLYILKWKGIKIARVHTSAMVRLIAMARQPGKWIRWDLDNVTTLTVFMVP